VQANSHRLALHRIDAQPAMVFAVTSVGTHVISPRPAWEELIVAPVPAAGRPSGVGPPRPRDRYRCIDSLGYAGELPDERRTYRIA